VPLTWLGSQAINKFATTELVGILKCSSTMFDKLLKVKYYDSDLLNKVGRNKRVIRDDLEKDDCESDNSADKTTMEEESTQQTTI
jgi:hypothetical protein